MVTVLILIGGSIITLSVPQFNASFLCSEVTLVMKRYCVCHVVTPQHTLTHMWMLMYNSYVTRSDKKGLFAHNRKSNFFTQIQSYMNALLDFSVRHMACDNWSASAGCLFLTLWRSVQAVWSIHGAMGGQ